MRIVKINTEMPFRAKIVIQKIYAHFPVSSSVESFSPSEEEMPGVELKVD